MAYWALIRSKANGKYPPPDAEVDAELVVDVAEDDEEEVEEVVVVLVVVETVELELVFDELEVSAK
jgi:hypothetical protein